MGIRYELKIANGTYQKDGETKTSWLRVGAVFEKNGRLSMKLDCIPLTSLDSQNNQTSFNGWIQLFEPRPREQSPKQATADEYRNLHDGAAAKPEFDDSSVPF